MTVHTCKPSSLYERYFEYADPCVRVRLCPDVYSGVASELAVVGSRCAVKGDWKSYGPGAGKGADGEGACGGGGRRISRQLL